MKTIILAALLVSLALAGCRNAEMEKRIPAGTIRILTDEQGRRYIVQHHIGDTYFVTPYTP